MRARSKYVFDFPFLAPNSLVMKLSPLFVLLLFTLPLLALAKSEKGFQTEYHVQVCSVSGRTLARELGFEQSKAKSIQIVYMEGRNLDLFRDGKILRVRKKGDSKADLTVKARPVKLGQADKLLRMGFDCEWDHRGANKTLSCDRKIKIDPEQVDDFLNGHLYLDELLDKHQMEFLGLSSNELLSLRGKGPARILKYERSFFDGGADLDLEVLSLGEGEIVELSFKASGSKGPKRLRFLLARLESLGIEVCAKQISKTLLVLRSSN